MSIFRRMDRKLLVLTIIFFLFGLVMIFSASNVTSFVRYEASPYHFLFKQSIVLVAGSILFVAFLIIPTKYYQRIIGIVMLGITATLLVLLLYGTLTNNAKSWFRLGFFSLQPSELSKVIMVVYLGCYYNKNKNKLDDQWTVLKPLIVCSLPIGLTVLQPDFGTAFIMLGIVACTFLAVPFKKKFRTKIFKTITIGAVTVVVILFFSGKQLFNDMQKSRFNFLEPCTRYQESTGYQVCNGYIAINNGGLFGVGLGNSTQKYMYLPESHNDFIFPVIIEELGVISGIIIIFVYLIILVRIVKISKKSKNIRNAVIIYGVAAFIFLHVVINLVGVLGLFAMTGVPLPFLSYGGSHALTLCMGLGVVQRIAIENNERNTKID